MSEVRERKPKPIDGVRGLRREQAARYVGLSVSKFDQLVSDGRMPKPKHIDGCRVWDRHELDEAFERLGDERPNRGLSFNGADSAALRKGVPGSARQASALFSQARV